MVCLACLLSNPSLPNPSSPRLQCLEAVRQLKNLSHNDIYFVKELGRGHTGSVSLVEIKRGGGVAGCLVASKVMDKEMEAAAEREKAILEVLDHPFLPRLFGFVQNDECSYLLTEYCNGGTLYELQQRRPGGRLDEAAVRFYASEVVTALEYLHMMGIIHRDLKPENVLIRSDGHIMLTDFDLSLKCDKGSSIPAQLVSKHHPVYSSCFRKFDSLRLCRPGLEFVAEPVDLRSKDFLGTTEYMAPEIVTGEEHGCSVDWWTLGIFIYELLYAVTPFQGANENGTEDNIVMQELVFPAEPAVSSAVRNIISKLLVKDQTKRLGYIMGATKIKQHPFFSVTNWAMLRCVTPPYVPPPYCRCREFSKARRLTLE